PVCTVTSRMPSSRSRLMLSYFLEYSVNGVDKLVIAHPFGRRPGFKTIICLKRSISGSTQQAALGGATIDVTNVRSVTGESRDLVAEGGGTWPNALRLVRRTLRRYPDASGCSQLLCRAHAGTATADRPSESGVG